MKIVKLQPGDVILVYTAQRLTTAVAKETEGALVQAFPGHRIVVMDNIALTKVVRPARGGAPQGGTEGT